MALTIKVLAQQSRGADRVFLTDLTGEYDAVDNVGGYGVLGTPNPDLAQLCLVAIVQRNASTGSELLEGVGTLTKYNPGASDSDVTIFELVYKNDGWHTINLVALPTSANQTTDALGNVFVTGDNYYFTTDGLVYIKTDIGSDEVTDLRTILDQQNIDTVKCEDMFLSTLSVERENIYQAYRATRKGVCVPDSQFNSARELTEDIISADLTFRSGLMVQSQDQVETVLDERNL